MLCILWVTWFQRLPVVIPVELLLLSRFLPGVGWYFSLKYVIEPDTWYCGWCIGHTKQFVSFGVTPRTVVAGWVHSHNKRHSWWTVQRQCSVELSLHWLGACSVQMHWCALIHTHGSGSFTAAKMNPTCSEDAELSSSEPESSLGTPLLPPSLTSFPLIPPLAELSSSELGSSLGTPSLPPSLTSLPSILPLPLLLLPTFPSDLPMSASLLLTHLLSPQTSPYWPLMLLSTLLPLVPLVTAGSSLDPATSIAEAVRDVIFFAGVFLFLPWSCGAGRLDAGRLRGWSPEWDLVDRLSAITEIAGRLLWGNGIRIYWLIRAFSKIVAGWAVFCGMFGWREVLMYEDPTEE